MAVDGNCYLLLFVFQAFLPLINTYVLICFIHSQEVCDLVRNGNDEGFECILFNVFSILK